MESKEVIQAFQDEKPVRLGSLVFNRIESVNYKRARYNQYIESTTIDAVKTGLRVPKTVKIIQAICSDAAGATYVLNPLRMELATEEEVNVISDFDHILTERLNLLPVFEAWRSDHGLPDTIESFIVFLYAEDIINAKKAYHIVEAFDRIGAKHGREEI